MSASKAWRRVGFPPLSFRTLVAALLTLIATGTIAAGANRGEYRGRLIDVHTHLTDATAIDAYVAGMKRHRIARVIVLGAGDARPSEARWLRAAARKYPSRVIAALPLADPTGENAAERLDRLLTTRGSRVIGEVDIHHVARRIDRDPSDGPFARVLDAAGKRGVPVVIHDELDARRVSALDSALAACPHATVILAHAGGAPPATLAQLLAARPNLLVDLSGMGIEHPLPLASETGHLDPAWKALIEKQSDRFLMGLDVSPRQLRQAALLDRLVTWTRHVLGELRPEVAERVAYRNASTLFHVD
jgi:predicted TIM-barrel fold metal-dependent hydrolase